MRVVLVYRYLEGHADNRGQPTSQHPASDFEQTYAELSSTTQAELQAVSRQAVDDWFKGTPMYLLTPAHAPPTATPTSGQRQDQVPPPSTPSTTVSTPTPSQGQESALPKAVPSTKSSEPKEKQEISFPKIETTSPGSETVQVSEIGSFDNYRTPPRSASVTDSSDEKKQRQIDASLLSPKRKDVSSDVPTMEFESLQVSERRSFQDTPKEPPSLIDFDEDLTPTKGTTIKTAAKQPILGSMESSMFASPVDMAQHQIGKIKVIAPPLSPSRSRILLILRLFHTCP